MPCLPFKEIDVLVLDEIGKNVSGAGMDTNIVGRGVNGLPREDRHTTVRSLYVRGLTPESHGNAVGMGLADVVRTRLVREMDPKSTYTNALSAMTPAMVRTPMHFDTDAECLKAALRMSGAAPRTGAHRPGPQHPGPRPPRGLAGPRRGGAGPRRPSAGGTGDRAGPSTPRATSPPTSSRPPAA